jgi:hypothetical protein
MSFRLLSYVTRNGDKSVNIATRIRAGRPEFDSRQGQEPSLLTTASIPAQGPTQPPIQWVVGTLIPAVKCLGHEADQSPPPSAEIMRVAIPPRPQYVLMAWHTVKHRFNFPIYLSYVLNACLSDTWPANTPSIR